MSSPRESGNARAIASPRPHGGQCRRRRSSRSRVRPRAEIRANLPELGEEAIAERALEIARAGRTAGALLVADHPFDHAHVPTAPQQKALVELDHILEQEVEVIVCYL